MLRVVVPRGGAHHVVERRRGGRVARERPARHHAVLLQLPRQLAKGVHQDGRPAGVPQPGGVEAQLGRDARVLHHHVQAQALRLGAVAHDAAQHHQGAFLAVGEHYDIEGRPGARHRGEQPGQARRTGGQHQHGGQQAQQRAPAGGPGKAEGAAKRAGRSGCGARPARRLPGPPGDAGAALVRLRVEIVVGHSRRRVVKAPPAPAPGRRPQVRTGRVRQHTTKSALCGFHTHALMLAGGRPRLASHGPVHRSLCSARGRRRRLYAKRVRDKARSTCCF